MSRYSKVLYEFYKRSNICPQCGSSKAEIGKTRCLKCLSYASERQREKIKKETEEEKQERLKKNREYRKKREEELLEKGICIRCGKKPISFSSKKYCTDCSYKNSHRAVKSG